LEEVGKGAGTGGGAEGRVRLVKGRTRGGRAGCSRAGYTRVIDSRAIGSTAEGRVKAGQEAPSDEEESVEMGGWRNNGGFSVGSRTSKPERGHNAGVRRSRRLCTKLSSISQKKVVVHVLFH